MIAPRTALSLASRRLVCRACTPSAARFYATPSSSAKSNPTHTKAAAPAKAGYSSVAGNGNSNIPKNATYEATTIAHSDADAGAPGPEIDNVDWAASYHGIASRPVTKAQFKVLMKPLEVTEIEVKPDGIVYLPEIKYRRRLNEAFGPMGWGMIPKSETQVGENIVTREYALIVNGRFVAQAQGENSYFGADQLPAAVEGCKSNALMRCCKDLGIASELWDPTFLRWFKKTHMETAWVEHTTTKKKRQHWFRRGEVDVAYPYKLTK